MPINKITEYPLTTEVEESSVLLTKPDDGVEVLRRAPISSIRNIDSTLSKDNASAPAKTVGEIRNTTNSLLYRVKNLEAAAEGYLYREETDSETAYQKTVPPGTMPWCSLDVIGGKSLIWNQLITSINNIGINQSYFSSVFIDGVRTYTSTLPAASATGRDITGETMPKLEINHIHVFIVDVNPSADSRFRFDNLTVNKDVPANEWRRLSWIFTNTSSANYLPVKAFFNFEAGYSVQMKNAMMFDLTMMFGAGR